MPPSLNKGNFFFKFFFKFFLNFFFKFFNFFNFFIIFYFLLFFYYFLFFIIFLFLFFIFIFIFLFFYFLLFFFIHYERPRMDGCGKENYNAFSFRQEICEICKNVISDAKTLERNQRDRGTLIG